MDVACGIGIVARSALTLVGGSGRVAGLDINSGMLEMAASLEPSIKWIEANVMDMPFSDNEFDVVVCQHGLQFVPDRLVAVMEMYRVLNSGGRVALSTWYALDRYFPDGIQCLQNTPSEIAQTV